MTTILYGVPLNGTSPVRTYGVIKETDKTYKIDRVVNNTIRKSIMADHWERYFLDKSEAEKFLASLLYYINKSIEHIDLNYVHKELTQLLAESTSREKHKLENLVKYVEKFL